MNTMANAAIDGTQQDAEIMSFPGLQAGKGTQKTETEVDRHRDDIRASRLCETLGALQDALDEAVKAGLEVAIDFRPVSNRFASRGIFEDSLLGSAKVSRQLL